ncbi:MAG: HepT-like ribonuclease domain-containing protein [Candidatus Aenigmatarchaeota archaeon]
MTKIDKEVIKRIFKDVYEALDEVKDIVSLSEDDFIKNRRARFSLRYCIAVIIESLADLAVAILEKDFDESTETYREAFTKFAEKNIIDVDTMQSMIKLVSLRNIIVHRYWIVDDLKIYKSAKENGIKGIEKFIEKVLSYVEIKDP